MRNFLLLLLSISILTKASSQSRPYWQQQANYSLQVQLDDILNSIDGYEKMVYTNNSPDTLHFIWFHLWPNAYKNDKTAFSEQMLRNGRTDFYFANEENRGYISNISFKVNDVKADTQNHPQYIDIVKVKLPEPLLPGQNATITTPFHVKLPYNYSRGGHVGQSYQLTQWYPKPAVYDSKGWHPIPYLDQGEFYSEFGNFEVQITLPQNYIVAASGLLQDTSEQRKLLDIAATKPSEQKAYTYYEERMLNRGSGGGGSMEELAPRSSSTNKTLHYQLANALDFAWFASKQFMVLHDTVQLQAKTIDIFSFYPPWDAPNWKASVRYAKEGLKYYDAHIGSYPYPIASMVSGPKVTPSGGMEYPSITLINVPGGGKTLDAVIAHELGHNWFMGALASNERDHPWMDEGMNSFYEQNYTKSKYVEGTDWASSLDENLETSLIQNLEKIHKDQPIELTSDSFTMTNYGLFVYKKTVLWMERLRTQLGNDLFEKAMKSYYAKWQFRHPYPEDFKQFLEAASNQNIDNLFADLSTTAAQRQAPVVPSKPCKVGFLFPTKNTDKYQYISVAPLVGYNAYDKVMVGGIIHNYQLPLSKFNFLIAPLYGTGSNRINYYARASYRKLLPNGFFDNININSSVSSFSYAHINFSDPVYPAQYTLQYFKIDPTIRLNIRNKSIASSVRSFIQLKTFFINEGSYSSKAITVGTKTSDSSFATSTNRHLAQLRFNIEDYRKLYPYSADLTIDANEDFLRAGLTANYFFNYPRGKNNGLNVRFFAGKFFHFNQASLYSTSPYFLTLTGPRGGEDYTYSNYFTGRTDFDGSNSQQLMERDGFFKVATDLQGEVGKTDNWLSAINFTSSVPKLPFVKAFVDIGTYAESWEVTNTGSHFLYDAGLQLSLFDNCVNVYVPIFYSKVYRDYYQSIFPGKSFAKSISFSIDIQKIKLYKLTKGIPL